MYAAIDRVVQEENAFQANLAKRESELAEARRLFQQNRTRPEYRMDAIIEAVKEDNDHALTFLMAMEPDNIRIMHPDRS